MKRWKIHKSGLLVSGIFLLFLFFSGAAPAWAATFSVTKIADTNDGTCDADCSLREAIIAANAAAGSDTIAVPSGTYTLTIAGQGEDAAATGDLDLSDSVIITGDGSASTILDAGGIDRVFDVMTGISATLTGLTIQNGNVAGRGAGVQYDTTLTLTDVVVTANSASGEGGGLYCESGPCSLTLMNATINNNTSAKAGGIWIKSGTGAISFTDSTISDNTASGDTGGMYIEAFTGSTTLNRVTISGNSADGKGGGIYFKTCASANLTNVTVSGNTVSDDGGGIFNEATALVLTNVTITGNSGGATKGGGLNYKSGSATVKNTIIANNPTGGDCGGSAVTSAVNNLDSDGTCGFANTADPLLGPLQDNGGSTFTHALATTSPAIDAGTSTGAPGVDQRGVVRGFDGDAIPDNPVIGDFDIGAYELWFNNPDITIDCDFSDWTNGSGTEFVIDDQGGNDDWGNPRKLDITRFGVASNLTDSFYILYGYDEVPPNGTAAVLIDIDLDDNIDFALAVDVGAGGSTVELYSCDNTLSYGCGNATLSKTYSTPGDYCVSTAAGPWNNDTFVEVAIPYTDLASFVGGASILTSLNSYNNGFWQQPKDSIFNDYYDRILYDTDDGTGEIIDDAGTPIVTGTVYADEGTTPVGPGKTVRLLVNGVDAGSDTTNANGDYLIIASINPNDAILVYIDDDATYQGSTVTVFDGVQIEGLDIYAGHIITRHDNSGTLSNSDMGTAKGAYSDSNILYSVSGGALTVYGSSTELYVLSGHSFAPGGDVTTPRMESLGTFDGGSGAIDINGTLTLSGGNFTATSGTMSVAGDFVNTGAAFSHNSGIVVMDGSGQSISGSNGFFDFFKSVSAADTLAFEAGSTQTFSDAVTLQGASGELLSLRSSSPGTRWSFTVNAGATKSIGYVDVQDSDASGSDVTQKLINPSNSVNSGNTIDWFPPLSFTDVTTSAGVVNTGNAYGITWEDYDNDGQLDLWIGGDGQLYQNNGDGTFTTSGECATGVRGGNWVDADNAGYMDLFASLDGSFYDNDGDGTFTERAVVANLVGDNLGTSAAIDYNTDGYIDFFFQNGNTSPGNEIRENDGDGTFSTIDGDTIGLGPGQSNGETCVVADVDNDGDIDIWYNDASDGSLYYNNGDGTFTEDAAGAGVSINMGAEEPYYAPVFGDYNNDGWLDLFLGHPTGIESRLYLNDGDGTFTRQGATAPDTVLGHARGAAWGDYDHDGDLDLLVGIDGGANRLFRNDGGGIFTDMAASLGIQNGTAATKSVSFADYDNDGDLDIYYANNSVANVLYRNNLNDTNYLKVKVIGIGSGYSPKDGIGTRIELWNSDMSTLLAIREVSGGEGYGNFPSRIQHFGLPSGWGGGDGTYVVRAKFTSGIVVTQQGVVPTGESIVVGSTTLNHTIEIMEAVNGVNLADHAVGQETNEFTDECSFLANGAELFAFQLTNNDASTATVDQIQFQLSAVTGIVDTDFANLEIYVDDNGDGTIDGSDTTGTVGGTGVVDAGVTTITFGTNFDIFAGAAVNYILIGDVNNLVAGDMVTIGLGTTDVTLISGSSGGSDATSVIHTAGASVLSFTNIAASAGVANTNPSTTGAVAFSDADNDGHVDVLFNGPNAGDPSLYLNNGDNTFAASSTFTALTFDRSIVFGDFNNDGQRDVAFTYFAKLHRNDTVPAFTDVTASSTLANANPEGVGWLDYDGDGWLDIVHPDGNSGSANLWRNNGDGTFSDRSASAGLPTSGLGNGEWVLVGDYNADGNTDIFYERGGASLYLFRNNGDGTFANISTSSGLGSAVGIDYRAGFCLGDYDNDGDFDLFVSQVGANNTLYRNNGNDTFSNVTATSGDINAVVADSYGCSVGDFDNDGDVDIFVTNNGAADHLFRNNGDDTFTEIGASVGLGNNSGDKDFTGVALADIDNDGDLDAFVNNKGASAAVLYRNDLNNTNYLRVKVIGQGSGGSPKDGTGTVVFLFNADGSELLGVRQVDGGRPMGQDEPIVHFGLPCSHGGGAGTYTVKALFTGGTYATSGQIVPFDESITIGSTTLSQTIEIDEQTAATAVNLIEFKATGEGSDVKVAWQTAHEIKNMGFYVYRADAKNGFFIRLTDKLIPGADFTTLGQQYEYIDRDVSRGKIYYYRLEDVDTSGTRTSHGPICVDWDADGMADDWEIAHGLDPTVNDADLDADNDGLTNLEEYERGSDPHNPDSDGDGILDGDEHFQSANPDPGGSLSLSRGVHVLASDETGITLELRTAAFETATVEVGAGQFEKLSIKEYVHGYTAEVGKPQLPLKGIMLDIPVGQSAHITVLDSASTIGYGYQVYPVPQNYAEDQSYTVQVAELFTMDADAYGQDVFYPASVVGLGEVYHFRDQLKQQLIFYPLSFNPVSGQIRHYSRIRVRIDYEDVNLARVPNDSPLPWAPPSGNSILNNPIPIGPMATAFLGPAFLNSPIISAIASLGTLAQSLWMPPGFDWTTQGPAYKILVADPGLYRLTGSYLAAGGVDLAGVNIGQVRLYNLGAEIALTVYDENGNNGFDDSDYIEFYATAVDSEYAKYTNNNVYWLTLAGGLGTPLRMGAVDGTPAAGPDSAVHDFTVHYEPDQGYWQEAPGVDSLDRWFIGAVALGDQIQSANAGQPVSFNLPLVDVVDSATGTLKIMLYGGYDTDHEVAVSYEGQDLGTFAWSGYTSYEVIIEDVNFSEQIQDGNYTVSVTCLSGFDRIAFDWIAATYPREFLANDDSLTFTHDAGYLFAIDDFSTDELMVLDISAADDPVRVQGFDIYEPVASSFSLEFETADDGQAHTYLVLAEAGVKTTVAALVEDSASDLGDSATGADYILITHGDIGWDGSGRRPWVDELVALRQAQGLRVKVVNVQDIYDEFSYGLVTPQAIKDFLSYAYENWAGPAPEYVLLVGDSSYDFKDNWKFGTINHVPSYLTYTEFMGETVTDEWFVTVSGNDAAADMYIGRLPAKSAAEAQAMVAKIIAYETGPNTKTWEKNTLLVADDQEQAFERVFKTMNEDAAALLPTGMNPAYKGYLQDYLDAGFSPLDLNSDIVDKINAGALIANFSGHGHLQGWASESIFDAGDIDALTNTGKYPFIVSMNCLTGYFAYPDPDPLAVSFAELLLRAEQRGAAAALMPTGMTTTEGQHVMNTALFETIFVEDIRKLGPAIARAKRELLANGDAYFEQVSQTFLLFGDPAMQLRVPLPRRPAGLAPAIWTKSGVALSWDAALDCNNDPVAGYNVYRSTSPTGNFTKINNAAITEEEFTDDTASAAAAAASAIYYYTVTAVDADGDESIASAMVASPSLAASPSLDAGTTIVSGGSGGGGGGCFVSSAATSFKLADLPTAAIYWIMMVGGVLALLKYCLKKALDSPRLVRP